MHRAVAHSHRTTHLPSIVRRGLLKSSYQYRLTAATAHTRHFLTGRTSPRSIAAANPPSTNEPLKSSMYFRRLPVALVSSLVVGYGAWYSYNSTTNPSATRSFATTATTADATVALPTRTVLVVGADELRQGTIVGDGPISKHTNGDGRKIVEMLTPDQATQKLRAQEKSFSVNRGQGVTRYDLVQLPSNDPIEDDHAEKIVQIPNRSTPGITDDSDWMFWGVYDGHS